MTLFASLYRLFAKRAVVLVGACFALVLVSGFAATRFVVREDVTTLMPTRPAALAEQFAILREAPLLQGLAITLGGPDPARAAAVLADALRCPAIPQVFSGSEAGFSPETLTRLCALSPGLMTHEQLAALPGFVAEDAMRGALARDARLLMTPRGLALRDMLAMDPFGICGGALRGLAPMASGASGAESGGPRLESGRLMSADGKYAMVLAEPVASVGDSRASAAVMGKVRAAVRLLPEGTEVLVAGGHRHTEANAGVIQEDMARVLPVSMVFLVVFFVIFVRSWQGLAICALPTASLAVAAACTGVLYGSLSGIVLGFGSVVLGITADYAIHVFYAVRTGAGVADSLERVSRPLLLGAATTLAGFAAFFASSIPCIVQMTVFAICGVLAAVFLALVVLPQCLRPGGTTSLAAAETGAQSREGRDRPPRLLAAAWIAMALILPALLYAMPVNGDVRALSYTPKDIAADEARTREIWGGLRNSAMFAVSGETLEAALEKNDRLWRDLSLLPAGSGFGAGAVTSLAPLLPSAKTQTERHAAWTAFWRERGPDALASLARLSPEAGFSGGAFAPFASWIGSDPETITPETLTRLGLPLPLLFIRQAAGQAAGQTGGRPGGQTAGTSYVYSLVPSDAPSRPFLDTLERGGATYVSGRTFRDALADATRDDMRHFGALALAAILGMAAFALRSPYRMGVALLPVALGLAAVLGVFRLFGLSLNIFHAMALPLIMSLSVDYGVFMLARQEGVLDSDSRKGILLSGLTTLSGFGSLLLAKHPALFSLGLTVTLGLAASLSAALWLVPRLVSGGRRDAMKTGGAGNETHG